MRDGMEVGIRRFGFVVLAGVLAPACSGVALDGGKGFGPAETGAMDSGSSLDTGDTPEDHVGPTWWKLGAAISIWEGALLPDESSLGLTLLAADGSILCEDTLTVRGITAQSSTPDPTIFTWWSVTHGLPQSACAEYTSPVPSPVFMGVGAMHVDIRANLEPADLADGAASLNAAYASLDGGDTVWVYGVAGTTAAYLGDAAPADSSELADGVWVIRAIYPFDY